jgi:hypothetical protein
MAVPAAQVCIVVDVVKCCCRGDKAAGGVRGPGWFEEGEDDDDEGKSRQTGLFEGRRAERVLDEGLRCIVQWDCG